MVQPTCYEISCWCCICRVFARCCKSKPVTPVIEGVNKAALESIGGTFITQITHARTHERTRTWHVVNGVLRYEVPEVKT